MKVKRESEVAQSCPTPSDPIDWSLPGSSVHGIFQARVLEWGAIAFSSCSVYKVLNIVPSIHECPVVVATNLIVIINNFSVGRIVANLTVSFPHLTDKNFGLHNIAFSFSELKDY